VAFFIGTIELLGLLPAEIGGLHGAFWNFMANFNINTAGYFIVGVFAVVWIVSLGVWRFGHIEDRWDAAALRAQAAAGPPHGGAQVPAVEEAVAG
jgi:high-affinity nickel-transport protein